jgi:hypothetical protein
MRTKEDASGIWEKRTEMLVYAPVLDEDRIAHV